MNTLSPNPIRKLYRGTICRVALQCRCPDTGERGSFLYAGEVKDKGSRVSPVFSGAIDLFDWVHSGKWESMPGCVYIYQGQ